MKCLVYGIYILEVVQSALTTEIRFWHFITVLGDVQVFNRIEMAWLVPTFTAIGDLSRTEHERLTSNIPPRYILCPGIICASDQNIGTIEESRGSNYCCKSSKAAQHLRSECCKKYHGTQLSFIQLGGGIAFGVHTKRQKYYTLLPDAKSSALGWSSLAVWTTTRVCSQLSNDITCRHGILGASFAISLLLYA